MTVIIIYTDATLKLNNFVDDNSIEIYYVFICFG